MPATGQSLPVMANRFRVGGDDGMKSVMEVAGDFDKVRRQPVYVLLSFANELPELNGGVATFVKVLLIRNAALVGIEMTPMKH